MTEKLEQTTWEFARKEYIEEAVQIMSTRTRGAVPVAYMHTYGCQQNVADGEKIKRQLERMGFSFIEDEGEANLILFSICAIRGHAEDRVFGNVGAFGNAERRNPSLIVAVCGYMMEQEHVAECMKRSFPLVNLVSSTHVIRKLLELMFHTLTDGRRVFERGDDSEDRAIVGDLPIRRDGSFKVWVTVIYGCNNFCSRCIVLYTRGRERDHKPEAIFEEVRSLVSTGYRGITLLGQNINSYGKELTPAINFVGLLRWPDAINGDFQLRFMMSHPKDATHELTDTIAQSRHISHYPYLPFQSDNNRILEMMNRSYTWERYLGLIAYTKEKIPGLSLTSNIIVGFPGETCEEFRETVGLIKKVEFISLPTFIYSPHIGTRATELPDPVSYEEKSRWFRGLLIVQEEIAAKRRVEMVSMVQRVLAEERSSKTSCLAGRSGGNITVKFDDGDEKIGEFCQVRVTAVRSWILGGELA